MHGNGFFPCFTDKICETMGVITRMTEKAMNPAYPPPPPPLCGLLLPPPLVPSRALVFPSGTAPTNCMFMGRPGQKCELYQKYVHNKLYRY